MQIKEKLFEAFREDHAQLGRGLYDLRTKLAAGDVDGARGAASQLDRTAGAHIAFEESEFYPALEPFLSKVEVGAMYQKHADGLLLINEILSSPEGAPLPDTMELIGRVDALEEHVAECGELFGAMGGLNEDELRHLWRRLQFWRRKAPSWRDFAGPTPIPAL